MISEIIKLSGEIKNIKPSNGILFTSNEIFSLLIPPRRHRNQYQIHTEKITNVNRYNPKSIMISLVADVDRDNSEHNLLMSISDKSKVNKKATKLLSKLVLGDVIICDRNMYNTNNPQHWIDALIKEHKQNRLCHI